MARFRRGLWLSLLISSLLFLSLYQLHPTDEKLYLTLDPFLPPEVSEIFHPGDYVDPVGHPDIHIPVRPSPQHEPDGEGTLHDVPENAFYQGGTLSLTTHIDGMGHPVPAIYDPYPAYNTPEWYKTWAGNFQTCIGPRGRDLDRGSSEDMISVYRGVQKGFPSPMFGSQRVLNIDSDVCVDRYSRYGIYGLEEDNEEAIPGFQRPGRVLWEDIDWGYLQSQCYERNADRYDPERGDQHYGQHSLSIDHPDPSQHMGKSRKPDYLSYKSRSAVVLRASESMKWTASHAQYLRSLIMELSLHSGSEYSVFFMVDIHNQSIDLKDDETIEALKQELVPAEFRNMTLFFSERLLEEWYPKMEEHCAIYQHLQAMQVFSQIYNEFDYYWQFEFDNRIIGHTYHFLEQAINFAKSQPRRYLWERNAYFYTPGVHGTWKKFSNMVTRSMKNKQSIWGPARHKDITPIGPKPPVPNPKDDNFKWGVGEEADLITFLPIFNPRNTSWTFPWMLWNLPRNIPRRTSVITQWRISKQLLTAMHDGQHNHGQAFASEMSAPSWALLHGLKAVHVPQPIYVDGKWSPSEMARIFNRGPPENVNGGPDSIWNWDHRFDYLWYRTSYMFATQTAEDLFRRWLGFRAEPGFYLNGTRHEYRPGRYWDEGGSLDEDLYGRLCFPFMLLHTIKNTELEKTLNLPVTDSALQDEAV
ncbi:hypothetical protein N7457_001652 [Penicillium paradoxum]|uniref:uncharacterized protein n=1 Tax=Penicillium paradoxum TaxID=176176 RepID=UPI002547B7D8|nr:uncharacterized protein N7457_001652 [Penicillium paradoxum]KAJ5795053.1 hypothetical protein N7457_001652 [Penicillium paradoxum]